ncbi:MAG: shikimate dehydrogenase, partial [Bacteroidales bacterium]|nr:shikimate dehydrogenase [Bacteroidales bacterium]
MDLYGLIGFPLGHSFSARFFTEKFNREGLDAQYRNFEIENAQEVLRIVKKHENLRGLNVTIPHKQAVIPLLDAMSDDAMEIGAVNVIRIIKESGKTFLEGHNTDVIGFTESIRPLLLPHHRKAL